MCNQKANTEMFQGKYIKYSSHVKAKPFNTTETKEGSNDFCFWTTQRHISTPMDMGSVKSLWWCAWSPTSFLKEQSS